MRQFSFIFFGVMLAFLAQAGGNTYFQVNSLSDSDDGSCDNTHCSLREAINIANSEINPTFIDFQSGLTGTIALTSQLDISGDDITIIGPGVDVITLSGQNSNRVLWISYFANNITVSGLTIANGNSINATGSSSGAGISARASNLLLEDLRIIDNYNEFLGAGLSYTDGNNAVLRNIEVSGNDSSAYGGVIINGGDGTVLIENMTVSGNSSNNQNGTSGMSIISNPGTTTIVRYLTVAGNINGNGIIVSGNDPTLIEASIFADNEGTDLIVSSSSPIIVNNSVIEATTSTINGDNNIIGLDPNLTDLMFLSGGKQQVHAFLNDTSIAQDHVLDTVGDAECGQAVLYDQINMPRPQGARCDAGAYEQYVEDNIFENGFE
ncbi:CSLREA domain-containing protein [Marinicella gelatinilytica]|uniref:CSLREA domain-containing protein n=1 Tax=Marinicella gelatinilytica TaxID=2996017 RepID=UPI002260C3BA|nr:CSLREA domain-containing protein [Marinicella gelatinilytica]MCX7545751.1 CSLREA domain-containing protein [Marinicella gelatinilytica]